MDAPPGLSSLVVAVEPVRVVPYDPRWPEIFRIERVRVEAAVGEWAETVEHVGSTAVPGLDAKPVVDVLVGLKDMGDAERCVRPLEGLGYSYWREGAEPCHHLFVRFANAERTARSHNLHLVEAAGEYRRERLLFRDYLRACPETAREYVLLKHELALRFREDREAYTAAKAGFVRGVVEKAKGSGA